MKAGLPPGWEFWKNARGETSFGAKDGTNILRLTNADSAAFLQKHPVQPGDIAHFSARVRASENFDGKLLFRLRWQDADGNWFPDGGGPLDLIADTDITPQWQTVSLLGRVPQGAAFTTILLGGEKMDDENRNDEKNAEIMWLEFSAPYLGKVNGEQNVPQN